MWEMSGFSAVDWGAGCVSSGQEKFLALLLLARRKRRQWLEGPKFISSEFKNVCLNQDLNAPITKKTSVCHRVTTGLLLLIFLLLLLMLLFY